jgi:sarcosine oxidase subunit alpha
MSEIEKDGAAPYRLPTGGRIDRGTTLRFTFGGRTLTGHPGDTLASALLAHGVHQTSTSIKLGRPRGSRGLGRRTRTAWSRSRSRSPSRCCWPPPSS